MVRPYFLIPASLTQIAIAIDVLYEHKHKAKSSTEKSEIAALKEEVKELAQIVSFKR